MANMKRFVVGNDSGLDPTITIQRVSDNYFWDDALGFIANGGVPIEITMTEHFSGFWMYETDLEVWANGKYNILIDIGGPFRPLASVETISGDTQIGFIEASSITSKNAVASIKLALEPLVAQLNSQATALGVLSDRIDSMNQTLARQDYGNTE